VLSETTKARICGWCVFYTSPTVTPTPIAWCLTRRGARKMAHAIGGDGLSVHRYRWGIQKR
jgi:hypothetical protein